MKPHRAAFSALLLCLSAAGYSLDLESDLYVAGGGASIQRELSQTGGSDRATLKASGPSAKFGWGLGTVSVGEFALGVESGLLDGTLDGKDAAGRSLDVFAEYLFVVPLARTVVAKVGPAVSYGSVWASTTGSQHSSWDDPQGTAGLSATLQWFAFGGVSGLGNNLYVFAEAQARGTFSLTGGSISVSVGLGSSGIGR